MHHPREEDGLADVLVTYILAMLGYGWYYL